MWLDRNYFTEGSRHLVAALAASTGDSDVRVSALLAAGALDLRRGDMASLVGHSREAVAAARRLGDRVLLADTLAAVALRYTPAPGPIESTAASVEALTLLEDCRGDRVAGVRASALHGSALLPFYEGRADEARRRIDGAIGELELVPDDAEPFLEGMTLGFVVLPEGPGGELRPVFEETIMLFHRFARSPALAYALCNKAVVERSVGRRDEAGTCSTRRWRVFDHSATSPARHWR